MTDAITALRNRAKTGLLFAATVNCHITFDRWYGYLAALRDLESGVGPKLAAKDACCESGTYEPPGIFKAAWPALPEDIEALTLANVRELLAAQGMEIAGDDIADSQINAVQQLKDGEVSATELNDEHASALIDGNNGSCLHAASCDQAIVSQEGGAE